MTYIYNKLQADTAPGTPVAEAGLDGFEQGLLPIARHFLRCYEKPDCQGWQAAYTIAAERWGDAQGLPVAHQMRKILRATLDCRPTHFATNDPLCPKARERLTADELALLQMIHHMRRDRTAQARMALDHLTQGRRDPHVIQAALSLAGRWPSGTDRPRPVRKPVLRAV